MLYQIKAKKSSISNKNAFSKPYRRAHFVGKYQDKNIVFLTPKYTQNYSVIGFAKSELVHFKNKVSKLKFYTDKNQNAYKYDTYWNMYHI